MAQYFPSMVVDFKLVFDDELTITLPSPVTVDDYAKGAGGFAKPIVQPLIASRGSVTKVAARVPKGGSVELPGHRPAGTFTLTFDFREMPIDPRTIRSAVVDIYIGTVSADAFAEGIEGISKRSVLDTSTRDPVMTGIVDEWEVVHGEDGSEITLSGRDPRGFLLDEVIATDTKSTNKVLEKINMALPIDEVVKNLLAMHPLAAGITVAVNPGEWDLGLVPAPSGIAGKSAPRHRKGAKGTNISGRVSAGASAEKMSFWDLVVKLCYMVGAIPHFVGSVLRIRPARSLYDKKFAGFDPLIPAPFDGGLPRVTDAENGKPISPLSIRKMVYGRDIEELRFRRKYGGPHRPRQVCCVGVDDGAPLLRGADKNITGFYPSNEVASKLAASGVKSMSERMWIRAPSGICDVEQLTKIAQAVYNEVGRGETGGTCKTKTLASFGGDNSDPDLLTLRPGDAVQFGTDIRPLRNEAPLVSEYINHLRTPFEQQVKLVTERLGDANLARVILATAAGQVNELQTFFRVAAVHYDWSPEGMKVDFDFQNYVEANFEQDESRPIAATVQSGTVPDQALGGL